MEPGGGVPAVVEPVQPGVQDQVPGDRVGVGGRVGVGDVVLGLGLGGGGEPFAGLDAERVFGTAAGVDVVGAIVDFVGGEAGSDGSAAVAEGVEGV